MSFRSIPLLPPALLLAILLSACPNRAASAQAVSRSGVLRQLDGKTRSARVLSVDADWQVEFEGEKNKRFQLGPKQMVLWGRQVEATSPTAILVDGSIVAGDLLQLNKERLSIGIDFANFSQRSVWQPTDIPLTAIRGVIVHPAADLATRDQLRLWLQDARARTDRVRLVNGDELQGGVIGVQEPMAPASDEDIDDAETPPMAEDDEPTRVLAIQAGAREATAPMSVIRAIAFNPATAQRTLTPGADATIVRLAFRDGSSVNARRIEVGNTLVKVTTVGGVELTTSKTRFIRQLDMLQHVRSPHFQYLSDLKPIGYRHIPFLTTAWSKPGVDANLRGGVLRADGGWSVKGLAMHSTSRLAFNLEKPYAYLDAELAIDQLADEAGSVTFRVYVDRGDGKFKSAFSSDLIRGGQPSQSVRVDIRDATRLALIVDFADRGDAGDHANWLSVRLIQEASR